MDGKTYRVRVVYNTLIRAFELIEGENAGTMLSGRYERDLIGTGYSYQMGIEPDPQHREDYDAFYNAISAPTPVHLIDMPFGQGIFSFYAQIKSGQDTFRGSSAGKRLWSGLTVQFLYIEPQRGVQE